MNSFNLAMGEHFIGARRRRIQSVVIVVTFANLTRELHIGFVEGIHRGRQLIIGGSEGGIDPGQFLQ